MPQVIRRKKSSKKLVTSRPIGNTVNPSVLNGKLDKDNNLSDVSNLELARQNLGINYVGSTPPDTLYDGMTWLDTANNIYKIYDLANTQWNEIKNFNRIAELALDNAGSIAVGTHQIIKLSQEISGDTFDILENIADGSEGDEIVLLVANGDQILVKDLLATEQSGSTTGNIQLSARCNFRMLPNDTLRLRFDGTNWVESGRSLGNNSIPTQNISGNTVDLSEVTRFNGQFQQSINIAPGSGADQNIQNIVLLKDKDGNNINPLGDEQVNLTFRKNGTGNFIFEHLTGTNGFYIFTGEKGGTVWLTQNTSLITFTHISNQWLRCNDNTQVFNNSLKIKNVGGAGPILFLENELGASDEKKSSIRQDANGSIVQSLLDDNNFPAFNHFVTRRAGTEATEISLRANNIGFNGVLSFVCTSSTIAGGDLTIPQNYGGVHIGAENGDPTDDINYIVAPQLNIGNSFFVLRNINGQVITLKHNQPMIAGKMRIWCPGQTDLVLQPFQSILMFKYDNGLAQVVGGYLG